MRLSASTTRAVLAAAVILTVTGCNDEAIVPTVDLSDAPSAASFWNSAGREPFKVYSQNVYLGGDTDPIFSLDFSNIPAVIGATNTFWNQVRASRIPERAASIVDEIAAKRPHLVGLEEVFQFAVLDMGAGGAVVDGADLLASIQSEISRRALPYEVVRIQANTAVNLPLSPRLILSATDRVVVLRRTDVEVTASAQSTYAARFTLGPVTLKRGWIRVSARYEDRPFHFIATHLETQRLAPVQAGQAAELLGGVADGLDGMTIISGDLNSDDAHPGAPSWTPTYNTLIAAGFVDLYEARGHGNDPGYTCCQESDLRNADSHLDERIDFVLARDARYGDKIPGGIEVEIVGEEQNDRTDPSGMWRADHAGLVAGLKLPKEYNEN